MTSLPPGDLKSNSNSRVRLFPLPYYNPMEYIWRSPNRSARIRSRLRSLQLVTTVTNRVILTLNRLYSSPATALPPSASTINRKHVNLNLHSLSLNSSCNNSLSAPLDSAIRPPINQRVTMIDSITPSSASRHQRRLMSHIRHQSANLLNNVRTFRASSSNACVDNEKALDIFSSYSFVNQVERHQHSQKPNLESISSMIDDHHSTNTSSSSSPRASTSNRASSLRHRHHFVNIEGPLAFDDSSIQDAPLLPSSSTFSSASTSVVPLLANRVALPDSLNIVPLVNVLPPDVASTYESHATGSLKLLRPEMERFLLDLSQPLKPARVAGSRHEYVKLIQRMHSLGMIRFTDSPKAVNGVFAVAKDDGQDRLIIDAQPANRCFINSPHVSLPNPSHLVQLRVPRCDRRSRRRRRRVKVGKSDLANFYHYLGLPLWMVDYFALPHLTQAELRSIGIEPSSSGALWPACLTLPMGFSHAVYLAQTAHEHVLYSSGALNPDDNITRLVGPPDITSTRALHGICIDDFFLFCTSRTLASQIFTRVLESYRAAGFVVKASKVVEPTSSPVKVIGFTISSGNDRLVDSDLLDIQHHRSDSPQHQTTIALAPDALIDLIRSTLALLRRGEATGLGLAHIIGRWTWCMLLRRPSLAALQHSYQFIDVAKRRRFSLWPSVRSELWMLLGLLPLLHARLDYQSILMYSHLMHLNSVLVSHVRP